MKEAILEVLKQIQDDARIWMYFYSEEGTYSSKRVEKALVVEYVQRAKNLSHHEWKSETVMLGQRVGLSLDSLAENVYYPTENTDEYFECVHKSNPYFNVFVKVDKEQKTITFKLGNKEKTLQLVEYTDFVHRPHRGKMDCQTAEQLERHFKDEFWMRLNVALGRKVLRINPLRDVTSASAA